MSVPAAGEYLRMEYESYIANQIGIVTSWWQVLTQAGGGATQQEICDFIHASTLADWQACNGSGTKMSGVRLTRVNPATRRAVEVAETIDNVTAGNLISALVAPKQAAAVVKKLTVLAGRANRGRIFIPFIPISFITSLGELSPAAVTAYTTFAANLLGSMVVVGAGGTATLVPVLVHGGAPVTSTDIIGVQVTGLIGNQRRRGDYGRPNPPLS